MKNANHYTIRSHSRISGILLIVFLLGVFIPPVILMAETMYNASCEAAPTTPPPRDARGHLDSCIGTTPCNEDWCAIATLPTSSYCKACSGECGECSGNPVTYYISGGECHWGYGNPENPRPNGECFCLYDDNNMIPKTAIECWE